MNTLIKTKKELLKELNELRLVQDALKTLYEKDITDHKQIEERLTISETNYRRLFETAKDGIILLDAETGMITDVNPFLIELLGYSKAQFVEKTIWEIGFFKDIVANHDKFLELQQKEYVRYENLPLEAADGRKINVEFVSNVYLVNHHSVIQCNIRDITNRWRVKEGLRESEEKYRVLFEESATGILIADIETLRFSYSNQAICQMFGYSKDEFQGLSITNIHPKDSLDSVMSAFEFQMQGEKTTVSALPCLRKNGTVFFADITSAPTTINGRKCALGFFTDVTTQKLAEEALKNSEERFKQISENSQEWIWELDANGLYTFSSQAVENILGYKPEEIIGKKHFYDFFIPEEREELKNAAFEMFKQKRPFRNFINRNANKNGEVVAVSTSVVPMLDNHGNLLGYRGVDINITESKRAAQELLKAKEHAEESDRLKSAFLANMSHEIRTPMNGILGFSELLKEPNLTGEEQQEYIRIIEKSSARMLNIITAIVSISKIESGQMEISISETNINEQIEFVYNFFKPEAEKKGIQLIVKNALPSKESLIKTDQEKIFTILTNLVNNAIKFTKTGFIEFGYEKKGKYLEFFVKDTGVGILQEKQEIIFERFRQGGDLTRQYNEGAGLGLSISKAYVEMLGGKIWVESEFGKGSIFYFTIPYNPAPEEKNVIKDVSSGIRADNQAKNLKILIAEDDEASEMFISIAVNKYGKEFLKAGTGVEAIEVCRNNPDIDLVLMDINMPEMNGYEATRQIRQFNKDVVIIAQTAYGLSGDREKAMEAGCNDYISKPIGINLLKELIQKHFNK